MVKIVLAGGAGNVGREVLETLLAENKRKIKVFSRKEVPDLASQGVTIDVVDYSNKAAFVTALKRVDTVLLFVITFNDPDNQSQRDLIDACIEACVRRFAPSQWATRSHCGIPAYEGKDQIYEHLRGINEKKMIQRARINLTSVQDLARIVAKAVEYEGAWPEVSGVCANQMPVLDFIGLCEKIRGQKFFVESVEKGDLEEAFILALERGG